MAKGILGTPIFSLTPAEEYEAAQRAKPLPDINPDFMDMSQDPFASFILGTRTSLAGTVAQRVYDFGAVRHDRTFKLLAEEAVQERAQPVADLRLVIFPGERVLGDPEDLRGAEAVADHVKEEEVVEFVWSD